MVEKILQCPYCGSDSTKVSDFYGSWCGTCLDCEATGPAALDINDAVLLWNAAANALEQKDAEIARLTEACDDLEGEYLRMKEHSENLMLRINQLEEYKEIWYKRAMESLDQRDKAKAEIARLKSLLKESTNCIFVARDERDEARKEAG